MAITFLQAPTGLVHEVAHGVPAGYAVGIVGEVGCGAEALLAAAQSEPGAGQVPADLVLNQPLALADALTREISIAQFSRARRHGAALLIYSHDEALLERLCDEIWWIDAGRLAHRGSPRETLERYRRHVAARLRASFASDNAADLIPVFRRGDGRAELISIETLADGEASSVWPSGGVAAVRITVRFRAAVENPVVGMLIRTRVGLDVYGTNTELEAVPVGPVEFGGVREIVFSFPCNLCAQEYTITAASHDPDGVWHDWMEDAIAVTVTDTRYTAGVANLRALVVVASK